MKIKVLVKRTRETLTIEVKDYGGTLIFGTDQNGYYRRLRKSEIEIIEE